MAKKEDFYTVKVNLDMEVTKQGSNNVSAKHFHSSNYKMEWPGMDYMQLVAVQQAINQLGQILVDMGWADAAAIGFNLEEIEAAKKVAKNE